jgi:dihydrofolate reductase
MTKTDIPLSIIVAVAENNAIGKDNQLLWHLSGDLRRFKKITSGHTVIMGKKTFESLPVRPLPGRVNIVISDDPSDHFEGCVMARSLEGILDHCDPVEENFIIGGGSVYRQFFKTVQKLYLTRVHAMFDADTFFPDICSDEWELIECEHQCKGEKDDFSYSFLTYQRKSNNDTVR